MAELVPHAVHAAKRPRVDAQELVAADSRALAGLEAGTVPRTSSLDAPTMLLTGHGAAINSVKFNSNGNVLASGASDKTVFLWNVRGDCQNYMMLTGHRNAVLEVQWMPDGTQLLSCSADKTVRAWDAETGASLKQMKEHAGVVNSVCPARRGPPLLVSGADDGVTKLWDLRVRRCVQSCVSRFPVTAVAFADAADAVYAGGLDNQVHVWDLRTQEVTMTLAGHSDSITGIAVSGDGAHVLSNSMDNTLRIWDVRPFVKDPAQRCTKVLKGHAHNFEKTLLRCSWSPDDKKVSAGSADRNVYIWDVESGNPLYKLPGHKGAINEVVFHPSEPIVASCSSDKTIFLGELAS